KGVQKVVVKKNLTHDMYENCLKSRKECMVIMHRLGSKDHIIRLLRSSKINPDTQQLEKSIKSRTPPSHLAKEDIDYIMYVKELK
ncbi:449_t:CDS:2, partial [Diversispora eburnea]